MSVLDGFNERIAQHRNRDFLKAAMMSSAVAAQADGTVTLSERYPRSGRPDGYTTISVAGFLFHDKELDTSYHKVG